MVLLVGSVKNYASLQPRVITWQMCCEDQTVTQ